MRVVTGVAAGRTGSDRSCSTSRPSAWASLTVMPALPGVCAISGTVMVTRLPPTQRKLLGQCGAAGRDIA